VAPQTEDTPPENKPPTTAVSRAYPRPTVDLDEAEWVWRDLAARSMRVPPRDEEVRLAVIAGLARATGARYSDLLRVTVDDLTGAARGNGEARDGGAVTVRHGKHRVVRRHDLGADVCRVLTRWLEVREVLCADLEGSVPRALLLTVHHTHDNGVTVSRGLPITAQGLVLSWRRYVRRTAAEQAGRQRPLPTRFEQVRRAWAVNRDDL
jgi:integrase